MQRDEQAKGMLASDQQISVDEAFDLLRRHSRNHNVSVHEVAAAVVDDRLGTRRRTRTFAAETREELATSVASTR